MTRAGATLSVVCAATALLLLNISAPNVALPEIENDLGTDFSQTQLIISAYSLTLAALLLAAGTLADLHGRRRMFLIGVGLFAAGSLGCAVAPEPAVLIAARALQGSSGAVIFSSGLGLLAQEFEGTARARALGWWGASIAGAFTIGPLVGGVLTESLGWRWIFVLDVVLAVPVAFIAVTRLRESSDPGTQGVDWRGALTLTPALCAGVFALVRGNAEGWGSPLILGLFGAALALAAAFVVLELRHTEPMLDVRLFRIPTFTASVLVTMAMAVASFAPTLYLTLYLLQIEGSSPTVAGLQLAPYAAMAFLSAIVAGRVADRVPLRGAMVCGMVLIGAGTAMMVAVDPDRTWAVLLPGLVVCGLGVGIINTFGVYATMAALPTSRSGTASGVSNTFRQLGIASGIAAMGALLQRAVTDGTADRLGPGTGNRRLAEQVGEGDVRGALASVPAGARDALQAAYDDAFVAALHDVLWIAAALAALGAVAALTLVREPSD